MTISRWLLAGLALTGLVAGPASAHDFWMAPQRSLLSEAGTVQIDLRIGHAGETQAWPLRPDRVLAWWSVGPDGVRDQQNGLGSADGESLPVTLDEGLHVVAIATQDAVSELPAKRFNTYAEREGLVPILEHRRDASATRKAGVERYSRRGKTLIAVGDMNGGNAGNGDAAHITRPLGLTLEITPLDNPFGVEAGAPMRLEVRYRGETLPGAVVKLARIDGGDTPDRTFRTDADGLLTLDKPADGLWMLHAIWGTPLPDGSEQTYDTIFSSLTFPAQTLAPVSAAVSAPAED